MKYDIIIIGAGAAGLVAMKNLLKAGYRVCLLEAAAVAGGRIATVHENGFQQPVELGAEFVHGKLPLTLQLLKKAGIGYVPVEGKMIAIQKEKWKKNEAHDKYWQLFMHQLGKLKTDISILQFLTQYFSGSKYTRLRESVQHFAEGFDLADISKASAMAALQEWSAEEDTQYRIPGGYKQLIDYLLAECDQPNASIHYNTCASKIEYTMESVTVHTTDNKRFEAAALVIAVSAGVLQSGMIELMPALTKRYADAIQDLGFGDVIKILLQFKTAFWTKRSTDIGFLLSDESIPTWWTQLPIENNLLTGWLGGPAATLRSGESEASLLQCALNSLSSIFNLPPDVLQQELVHFKINCWRNHLYTKGGYSYVTVNSADAKKVLSHPIDGIIFFAGEAVYRGESQGTVEAALQSGKLVARQIKEKFSAGTGE